MDPEKHRWRAVVLLAGFLFARYESDRLTTRFAGLRQPPHSLDAATPGTPFFRAAEAGPNVVPRAGIFERFQIREKRSQTPKNNSRP